MLTIRTTIRLRKDLLEQSKLFALKTGTSMQEVINNTLAQGFGQISDLELRKQGLARIDQIRESIRKKSGSVDTQELIYANKKELKERTNKIL